MGPKPRYALIGVLFWTLVTGCSPTVNEVATTTDEVATTPSATTEPGTAGAGPIRESLFPFVWDYDFPRFGGDLPGPDDEPIKLEQVLSVDLGHLRHQYENKGPVEVLFDSDGLAVISPAAWRDLDQSAPFRHPTVIARVANGAFARLLENPEDAESRDIHLRHARWLRDTLVWDGTGMANWEFPMALDEYGVESGWRSAMTNGFGMAVMFQAAALASPDEGKSFVEAANGVLKSLSSHVDDGGVARPVLDGSICFEEVADPAKPHCIFNGHHYALAGIQVASDIGSEQAEQLLQRGIRYTANHMDNYDVGFASLYSLDGKYAEPGGYNKIHVNQLLWLYYLTGSEEFKDRAERWYSFERDPLITVTASDTIDPDAHHAGRLIDDAPWWGYWSSIASPVVLDFSFGADRTVCGIAIFALDDGRMPFVSADLIIGNKAFALDSEVQVGTNANASGLTSAASYELEQCVSANFAQLRLEPMPGKVLALREVDFLIDRSGEVSDRLETLIKVFEYGLPAP